MAIVRLDDLFDFSGSDDLQKLTKRLRALDKVFQSLEDNVKSLETSYSQSLKAIDESTEKYNKSLNSLSSASKKEIEEVFKLEKALEKLSAEQDKLIASNKKLEAELSKLRKQRKETNELEKEGQRLARQKARLDAKQALSTTELAKDVNTLNEEIKANNREQRQNAKLTASTTTEYEKLAIRAVKAKREFKDLAAQFGATSKQAENARIRASKLDKQLKDIDKSVGDNQREVGNYRLAVQGLAGNFQNLLSSLSPASATITQASTGIQGLSLVSGPAALALGGLAVAGAGIAALGPVISKQIELFRDYGLAISKVEATTGATSEEIERLDSLAKRLGATTQFTATEVATLQLNFSKLGFSVSQIENATEATLNLAAATDTDLAQAAEVAASTINSIGLTAEDTGRVTDVMAKSFNTTALDIEKFRESIKDVAPFAKATGSSIEETTAALGVLADAGISGTQAGTGLKQIFREIKEDGRPLAETLKDLQKEFGQVTSESEKLALAEAKVGKISQAQLLILVDQADKLGTLKTAFDGAAGAAAETARVIQDNLEGDIRALNSAFEGLLLEGEGFNKFLRGSVKAATNLISAIAGIEKETKDYSNGLRDEVSLLQDQQFELNAAFNVLNDYNLSQERRNSLTDGIIRRFPQYNDVLNKENLSLENLEETRKLLNSRIEESILLKIKEATQTEILTKKAEAQISIQRALVDIEKEDRALQEAQLKGREDLAVIAEQNIKNLEQSIELNEGIIESLDEQLKAEGEILDSVLNRVKGVDEVTTAEVKTKEKAEETNEEYSTRFELLTELFNKQVLLNKELGKPLFEQKPEEIEKLNNEIERLKDLLSDIDVEEEKEKEETKKKEDPEKEILRTRIKLTKDLEQAQSKLNAELEKAEVLQRPEKIAQLNSEIDNLNKLLGKEKEITESQKGLIEGINKGIGARIDLETQLLREQAGQAENARERQAINEEIARKEAAAQEQKAFVTAFANSIADGDSASEALSKSLSALAGLRIGKAVVTGIQGLHTGGYTGDGSTYEYHDAPVHKGEYVMNKDTTTKLGLRHKQPWEVDKTLEAHYFNRFKMSMDDHNKNDLSPSVNVTVDNKIDYDELGKNVAKYMPRTDMSIVGNMFRLMETQGSKTINKIFTRNSDAL